MSGVGRVGPVGPSPSVAADRARQPGGEFKEVWAEACARHQLKFSRHAIERLENRNCTLNGSDLERLGSAVARAGEKGARESLVLLDELAFVVSVQNRTVITAMQPKGEGVFTSIDSAVIA